MLPKLTRHCTFCFKGSKGVQLGFRNLTNSSSAPKLGELMRAPRPSFPWLQKYKFYSGIQGFYNRARLQRTFNVLSGLVNLDGQVETLRNQMIRSGIEALRFSTGSIFGNAQEKFKVIPENATAKVDEMSSVIPYLPISDVFDVKLAEFYEKAIQDQFSYRNQLCTYTMHNIHRASIVDVKILVNAQRGQPLPKHDYSTVSYGLICFVDESKVASANPLKLRAYIESLIMGNNYNMCTVHVTVNVDCTETFAIMDADSKYVVQGSLFPSKATHQVVLENTIDGATRKLGDKWLVVDIDEWLEGNRFWEIESVANSTQD